MRDFYGTMAQVLPVLMLALVWESNYFDDIATRAASHRFWTLTRIRVYALVIASTLALDLAVCILVLAGALPDSSWLRAAATLGLLLGLGSLVFRICTHIITRTR